MKKPQQEQQTWTLWGSGITVQTGTFIEYEDRHHVRVARVQEVRVVSVPPSYPDAQVIHVKLYGPLSRHDGPRVRIIPPAQVLRVLDAPPPPAAKALTALWSPRDDKNPFRIESMLTDEAWKETRLWYPFSVRVLETLQGGDATWQEQACTQAWGEAKDAMQALAHLHREKPWLLCWVVMKCERRGKEGREKPVIWYPGRSTVERVIQAARSNKSEVSS